MCEFCKNHNEYKSFGVVTRNSYADDNVCEYIRDDICDGCDGCTDENFHFTLYKWQDTIHFGFHHQISDFITSKTSEKLTINYCPWCGEKMNDNPVQFEKSCICDLLDVEK